MKNRAFNHRARFALQGIKSAFREEKSFRTQASFAVLALAALVVLRPDAIWWALVLTMITLVLAAELINTALENLVDHLHPEAHPRIGTVKDCAAGAVLLLSACSVIVGILMILSVFTET